MPISPDAIRNQLAQALLAQQGGGGGGGLPPEVFPGFSGGQPDLGAQPPDTGGLSSSQFDNRFNLFSGGPSYSEGDNIPGGQSPVGANTFRDDAAPSMDPNLDQFARFGGGRYGMFGIQSPPGPEDRSPDPYGPQNVADNFQSRFNPLQDNSDQRAFDIPAPSPQGPAVETDRNPEIVPPNDAMQFLNNPNILPAAQGNNPFSDPTGGQEPASGGQPPPPLLPQTFFDQPADEGLPSLNQRDVRQVPASDMLNMDNYTPLPEDVHPVDLGPQGQPQGGGQLADNAPGGGPQAAGGGDPNPPAFFPAFDPFAGTSRLGFGGIAGAGGSAGEYGAVTGSIAAAADDDRNPATRRANQARLNLMRTGRV